MYLASEVKGGTSLIGQWSRICLVILEMWVQSLVQELGSHTRWGNRACVLQQQGPRTPRAHALQQEKPRQ